MKTYRKSILLLLKLLLVAVNIGIFSYVFFQSYQEASRYVKGNLLVIAGYAVLLFSLQRLYNSFEFGFTPTWELAYSGALGLLLSNALAYIMICLIANRSFLYISVLPLVLATVVQTLVFSIGSFIANRVYAALHPVRRLAAICLPQDEEELQKFAAMPQRYEICEVMAGETITPQIWDTLAGYEAVYIGSIAPELRRAILTYCYSHNKRVYLSPQIADILVRNAVDIQVADSLVFLCRNRGLSFEQRILKRLLDVLLAVTVLVPALPFMAVIAAAIKLQDGGPVLYKQQRLTQNGKIFYVYKFRSMVLNAEKDGIPRLACENDTRITPVGRVIRKIRLDELPQLFNILRGDMSFVGPRPERPEIVEQYARQMPEFNYRLKVQAGLTGYAQVWGKYNTTPQDKLRLDLMYIENYSLMLDIKLILLTVKVLFMPKSTQGVEQGTVLPHKVVFKKHTPDNTAQSTKPPAVSSKKP